MKRMPLMVATLMVCLVAAPAWGQEESALMDSAQKIDQQGSTADGEAAVKLSLQKTFNIDNGTIEGLKARDLGLGEIAILLAVAEKMPGGVTGSNMDDIVPMCQGKPSMSWEDIAKTVGVDIGPVAGRVAEAAQNSEEAMKEAPPVKDKCGKPCETKWGNEKTPETGASGARGTLGGSPAGY